MMRLPIICKNFGNSLLSGSANFKLMGVFFNNKTVDKSAIRNWEQALAMAAPFRFSAGTTPSNPYTKT